MMEETFGEILKKQTKLGVKRIKVNKIERNQSDDEAPLEMSSKRPKKINHVFEKRQAPTIDPRFSDKFGKYNEEKFRENFKHAFDLRDEEMKELRSKKKKIDGEDRNRMKKMENQEREFDKRKKIHQKPPRESNYFPNKRKQRAEDLLTKFKQLKSEGKLEKYLDKRRKKESAKSRKKMKIEK